jgi:hypothetical protein
VPKMTFCAILAILPRNSHMLQQGQQPFVNNLEFLRDSTTKKPTHRKFISSVGIWNGLSNLFERDSGQLHL